MKNIKTILIASIFPLLGTAGALAQTAKVYADIRGKDCNGGSSFCSATSSASAMKSGSAETTFTKISENSISVSLENFASLSKTDQYFVQDADFILDESILKLLNINPKFAVIKQGKYPIVLEGNKRFAVFILSE
ncbi:MAG: hypothetical protein LBE36_11300 [Flavobacteriaceae bacterium]|jgi:hypothetical protein|nr:hypothetical protein [Flavobacteriaceae bacterium]